jgi:hypothetical protein
MGIASAHADPEHLWKQLNMNYTMDTFRKDVKNAMTSNGNVTKPVEVKPVANSSEIYRVRKDWSDVKSQIGAFKSLEGAKAICKSGYKVFNSKGKIVYNPDESKFLVKVTASNLNYRSGPGTNYKVMGTIRDKGTYTIIEVKQGSGAKAGWGRLSSKAGWISLDYVKRL